jgi:phage gp36-like protein
VSSYATIADLSSCGLPPSALASISIADKQAALDDHSAEADTYIGDKYQLPLGTPYDRTLVRMVCFRAAWDLLCLRGFNASDPTDAVVSQRADQALKWLERVANGQARLNVVQGTPESFQPDVSTNQLRGWSTGCGTDDPSVFVGG